MEPGVFERKLHRLNRRLHVFCGDSATTAAGIWLENPAEPDGYEHLCGIDKNEVPEHSYFNENGSLRKGGWRRVLRYLIQRRLVDRRFAEKLFSTHLEYAPRVPRASRIDLRAQQRRLEDKYGAYWSPMEAK
jgi:hypothetical protein